MEKKTRKIIHLDMDAFYASVETLDNPALQKKPIIVGGGTMRGVVSAASYEARRFGIHSAMPISTARRLCPDGIFLPVRMARYQEISARIFALFQDYTELVEPLSLDEAFLDITGSEVLFGPARHIAIMIKERVRREIGLTVSAGIASSKLLAKIASDLEKPDGLTVVEVGEEAQFLAPLPIEKLWGVGRTTRQGLALLGVRSIGDLSRLDPALLEKKFGQHGLQMHRAALGLDERPVEPEREMKSIGHEETFDRDLVSPARLQKELLALANRVGRRLRQNMVKGRTLALKVKYHDFRQISRSITLKLPCDDGKEIFRQACLLLEKTEAGKTPVRLLGLSLANLTPARGMVQKSLFGEERGQVKQERLNQAVDRINMQFGNRTMVPARLLEEE